MDPPDVWPYRADQRVEFINRDDVADALFACVHAPAAKGKILNLAGGKSWQLSGREYLNELYKALELEPGDAVFSEAPGWFDWYDTEESQAILKFQNTPFAEFVRQLHEATMEALGM